MPIDVQYIAKVWKSGLIDFYIYLPTTYTYYVPHVDGVGNCSDGDNLVQVNS